MSAPTGASRTVEKHVGSCSHASCRMAREQDPRSSGSLSGSGYLPDLPFPFEGFDAFLESSAVGVVAVVLSPVVAVDVVATGAAPLWWL